MWQHCRYVVATREGPWRTKSATNAIYGVKDKAGLGQLRVTYANTLEQGHVFLTKFSRGRQYQQRAREHLSVIDVGEWLPGRNIKIAKVFGVSNTRVNSSESFRPRVCRAFVRESCSSLFQVVHCGAWEKSCVRREN